MGMGELSGGVTGSNQTERAINRTKLAAERMAAEAPEQFTPAPEPTAAPAATPDPEQTGGPQEEYTSDFFSKGKKQPKPKEEEAENAETAVSGKKDPESVPAFVPIKRVIKAAGKEQEVEITSEAELDKALAMYKGGKKAFSERAKALKELEEMKSQIAELKKYQKAVEFLDEVKDDDEALFERATGRKLSDAYQKRKEKEEFFATATPDEIEQFETLERLRKVEAKQKRAEEAEQAARDELKNIGYESEKRATKTQLETALSKVSFASIIKDPVDAHEWDESIKTKAVAGIKRYWAKHGESHPNGVPQKLIDREFDRAAAFYKRQLSVKLDDKVAEIDQKRTVEATSNAQLASAAKYTSPEDLDEKAFAQFKGRPTKMWGPGGVFSK